MGGHALKYETKRLSRVEYFEMIDEITPKLIELQNLRNTKSFDKPFSIIKAYNTKESFGDIDILMNTSFYDYTNTVFIEKIKELFNYTDMYINPPFDMLDNKDTTIGTISFDYKGFQIDLIFVNNIYMETAETYFSYNDLGNFMGRMAVTLGVHYGHYGLKYRVMTEKKDGVLGRIIVSSDMRKIFEFLGFDYDRYLKGYETLEEVFEYVIQSKYFNKDIFAYENLDHQNRTRNRKRESYRKFLEYIEPLPKQFLKNLSKKEQLDLINTSFPETNLLQKIQDMVDGEEQLKQVKLKFNGNIIIELIPEFKTDGKALGKFIKLFKEWISANSGDSTFEDYIINTDSVTIKGHIKNYWVIYMASMLKI